MTQRKRNLKIVKLNNKTRKGTYIYFRKGDKSHYYKIPEDKTPQQVIQFREKPKNKYLRQITTKTKTKRKRTKININKTIKKGITTARIRSPTTATNTQINKAKTTLLKPLVNKTQDLKILTQDTNFNKTKRRLEYKLTLLDKNGNTLGTANKLNTTPKKAIQEIRESVTTGEETAMFETSPTILKLKRKGWNVKTENNGRIANTTLRIIFRKSK